MNVTYIVNWILKVISLEGNLSAKKKKKKVVSPRILMPVTLPRKSGILIPDRLSLVVWNK